MRTWQDSIDDLKARGLHRSLRLLESPQGAHVTLNGRPLCNFCSNDYLALANHPKIKQAVQEAVERWGWGAGASRLVAGHMQPHQQLQQRLAAFKQTEAALVFSTGYQANLSAVRSLAGTGDIIFIDKLNHASIIDAVRGSGAVYRVFPHRDYDKLRKLLDRSGQARRRVIVTDSLFSMDGDFADLRSLVELKERYDALLCIDEAHATGVLGPGGRGVAALMGVEDKIDVTVGTLSKALGGIGGFVAGSAMFIEYLINTAGPFIYTTAIPSAACLAAVAALDIVEAEPQRRARVLALSDKLRAGLQDRGFDTGGSTSQITPWIIGDAQAAIAASRKLEQAGFLVPAIRPPTVPRGKARLRISICAEHTEEDVERLLAAIGLP